MNKFPATQFTDQDIEVFERKTVYQGYYHVEKYQLRHKLFNGDWSKPITREVFERGNAVGVLLFDPKLDKIILTEQFRVGTFGKTQQPWLLELVAGIIEEGEKPEDVAKREVEEEANLKVLDLLPIFEYWASPGAMTEKVTLFCARIDASEAGGIYGLASEGEDIRVWVLDVAEVYAMLEAGKINNALSIIALQWFKLHEDKIREKW